MEETVNRESGWIRLTPYVLIISIVWTSVVGGIVLFDFYEMKQGVVDLARAEALAAFNKDVVYRKWCSDRGGVYVPVSEDVQPNPYLSHLPERDIETTSGMKLTLINPAYMTRQVQELEKSLYGVRGHITSLNPLRPENEPDPWEKKSLEAFDRGEDRISSIERMEGEDYLRFMKAFVVEEACLKCHAQQGYQIGDVRGGVSVSVPLKPHMDIANSHLRFMMAGYGFVWILGLAGLGIASSRIKSRFDIQSQMENKLRESEERLQFVLEGSRQGYWDWNVETGDVFRNKIWAEMLGYTLEEIEYTIKQWTDLIHEDDRDIAWKHLQDHLEGRSDSYQCEYRMRSKDGSYIWVLDRARIVNRNPKGEPVRMSGTHTDITLRKRMESVLEENEKRMSTVFNAIEDAVFLHPLLDEGFAPFEDVNDTACKRYGYTREEFLTLNASNITKKEDAEYHSSTPVRRNLRERGRMIFETTHVTKSGEEFPVEINSAMIELGDRPMILAVVRDITERKQSERALLESEQKFRLLFESMIEGVALHEMIYDENGAPANYCILDVNPAYEKHTGIKRESAIGMLATDLYNTPVPPYIEKYSPLVRNGGHLEFETYFSTMQKHFNISVFSPQKDIFATIFEDITERKIVEEKLRFTQFSVDRSAEEAFWSDPEARIVFVNDTACSMLGYSRDELLNMSVMDVDPNVSEENWSETYRSVKERGSLVIESVHRKKDGTEFPIEINVNYLEFDGKEFICGFARDISERKKLEGQLLQSQKMEAVGKLAGGVAHDFNNLLMVINGYSDYILSRPLDDGSVREAADEIQKAGARAASLTKQLLAYSRKQVLSPKIIDLNVLLTDMNDMLKRLIGEDIDFSLVTGQNLGRIKADPTQIEQIVMNLIVNARDAMPGGGFITIETQNIELDRSYAQSHIDAREGSYVMLAVTDAGQGMDGETLKHIFDPFFTTKTKDKGTGLGMSTVYGIAKQSEGHVNVYSELNRGTTVKVYLPRIDESSPVDSPIISQGSAGRGSETVLLVEDEDMVRNLVHRALTRNGYTVLKAEDGLQAIQCMEDCKDDVHLLITDVVLPKMSGREIADVITAVRPSIKVLFMSGYTDNAIVHHGILDEGINFIQKPFSPNDLLKRIRSILDSD